MRLLNLICLSGLVNASLALAPRKLAAHQFGFSGETSVLDDFGLLKGLTGNTHNTQTSSATTLVSPSSPGSNGDKKAATISSSVTIPTGTSYSVIGTLPPVSYAVQASHSASTPSPSASSLSSPTASPSPTQQPSNSTASSSTSEWKIIGVAVIAFSAVAAILLLAVFFDQWWRFVRDLIWRRRKKENDEELVPDWEKAQWELRLAKDPELARYPSFASLPSSLPSVPVVPTLQREPSASTSMSRGTTPLPPQGKVALGRSASRRDAQARALERGFGEQQEQRLARRTSVSRHQHPGTSAGIAGVGVGLGLGRVESVKSLKREERTHVGATSPLRIPPSPGHARGAANEDPFCDPHPAASTPEDVYGGIE